MCRSTLKWARIRSNRRKILSYKSRATIEKASKNERAVLLFLKVYAGLLLNGQELALIGEKFFPIRVEPLLRKQAKMKEQCYFS